MVKPTFHVVITLEIIKIPGYYCTEPDVILTKQLIINILKSDTNQRNYWPPAFKEFYLLN